MKPFGRGIEALIPRKKNSDNKKQSQQKQEPVFFIEIDNIKPNPYQARKDFDSDELETLADSIRQFGIIEPLIATEIEREVPGGLKKEYQLIAGERRLRAAKLAGLTRVPLIVRYPTEREKLEISLLENIQRSDLNPLERAEAFKRLHEEFNFSHKEIGTLVKKSREVVSNTLRFLNLSQPIQRSLREGKISEGHAVAILMVKDSSLQETVFNRILQDGLTVKQAESLARGLKLGEFQAQKPRPTTISPGIKDLISEIKEKLGARNVRIGVRAGRPKLTIFFNSEQEIKRLAEKLRGDDDKERTGSDRGPAL